MTYHKKMYKQDMSYWTDSSTQVNSNHQSLKQVSRYGFFNIYAPSSKVHKRFSLHNCSELIRDTQ